MQVPLLSFYVAMVDGKWRTLSLSSFVLSLSSLSCPFPLPYTLLSFSLILMALLYRCLVHLSLSSIFLFLPPRPFLPLSLPLLHLAEAKCLV